MNNNMNNWLINFNIIYIYIYILFNLLNFNWIIINIFCTWLLVFVLVYLDIYLYTMMTFQRFLQSFYFIFFFNFYFGFYVLLFHIYNWASFSIWSFGVCFSLQSKVFDLDFCSHILADVFWKIYNIFFFFQKLWLVCSYLRLFWILCSEFAWFFSPYSLNGYYFIGTNLSFSTSGFFFFLEILIVGLFLFDYWNDGFLWSVLIWLFEWCWS